ncbi:TetR/AcrR family transcriptional regulator [Micromonospora tulbaghiae]|uniref:TetR/AcrR family transcriptional regulator n=1 Tax=Micromonospora tulbaghiae TaxID=479978 RepID=UPI0033DB5B7A
MDRGLGSPRRDVRRSRQAILTAVAQVLVEAPHSSLGEIAEALGISRTTLHRMFATRRDLVAAVALDAIEDLARVYAEIGFGDEAPGGEDVFAALRQLVERMVPLGPKLRFLLSARELHGDETLDRRIDALDAPVLAAIDRARNAGLLRKQLPGWWAMEMLFATVFVAWEQIEAGRLAPLDAPELVLDTWLSGTIAPPTAVQHRR